MTTNNIRRAREKSQILKTENLNWVLSDFIQEFSNCVLNENLLSNKELQEPHLVIEKIKKNLNLKYNKILNKSMKTNQTEFKFYE